MSMGGDAADQMVREGIQVTESAVKLAGLGAKNLAALLLALLREHQKMKGKSSIDRLLHDEKPLSIFHVKKADLKEFTKLSKEYGVLFHPIYNKKAGRGLCDVLVKSELLCAGRRVFRAENFYYQAIEKGKKGGKKRIDKDTEKRAEKRKG